MNRCSPSMIWSWNIPSAPRSFMPCPACPCRSPVARRWVWSANPAAENRRWAGRCCSCSGGQCQRICIARALILNPEFIVCDEPVSALDVSIRAQILNLLEEMKGRFGLTLLFIAHDLAVVKAVSDRVAVMYLGRLCEVGPSEQLFARPAHPYTALLIEAIPVPDPDVRPTETVPVGEPPSPIAPPSGCRSRTRW